MSGRSVNEKRFWAVPLLWATLALVACSSPTKRPVVIEDRPMGRASTPAASAPAKSTTAETSVATASGVAMALGGGLRDAVDSLAMSGQLGEVLQSPVTGYSFVYHLELYLLFVVLVALGPMLRKPSGTQHKRSHRFGLAELPG